MTIEQKNIIASMRKAGVGYTKIAQEIGVSENTVKSFCRRNGLTVSAVQPESEKVTVPAEKSCRFCGAPFIQYPGRKVKKFCSPECRNKFWNAHINDEKRKAMETYICLHCGKEFYAYAGHGRKYCSHECYISARFGGEVCV